MRNDDIAIEEGSICVVQDVVQNSEPMRSVNTTTHYEELNTNARNGLCTKNAKLSDSNHQPGQGSSRHEFECYCSRSQ